MGSVFTCLNCVSSPVASVFILMNYPYRLTVAVGSVFYPVKLCKLTGWLCVTFLRFRLTGVVDPVFTLLNCRTV